eukprot:scaffold398878_cov16-Attheya_sp.AAC.1
MSLIDRFGGEEKGRHFQKDFGRSLIVARGMKRGRRIPVARSVALLSNKTEVVVVKAMGRVAS